MGKSKKGDYKIKDHQLYFSRLSVLFKLFNENKVSPKKRWMKYKIYFFAILTQIFIILQRLFYSSKIKKVDFKNNPPIFILGHWRSGTTHLHYLMAKDSNLGFVSNFDGFMITLSLIGKGWLDKLLSHFVPKKRPMDNVGMDMFSPSEEDQCVANLSTASGIHSFFFPKNRSYFDKFTTLEKSSDKEKKEFERSYDDVLRIVSVANKGKRLLLKNPSNTARPTELAQMYPGAKFIFIHRNPYEVYRSTLILQKKMTVSQYLQDMSDKDIDDLIFENYKGVMSAYFKKRKHISKNDLVEISFDELNEDPIGTMKMVYNVLGLPNFDKALPEMKAYLNSVKNYKKNTFKPLPNHIVERVKKEWGFSFDELGYDLEHSEYTMKALKRSNSSF